MTAAPEAGRYPVLFVGAGPGDPELITVRGQRALSEADLVVYTGSLVPEALLRWTRPAARCLTSADLHLDQVIAELVAGYRAGERVVRLHTGDPSLYGAIAEQMAELRRHGVPYAVVPGVTAAFAAAAALGIEFTLPEVSQTLILTRMAGRTPVPEPERLEALAAHGASLAIYLSVGQADEMAATLGRAYGPDAPCAVVYRASQPEEKIIRTRLCELADRVQAEGVTRQAVVIVGRVLDPDGRAARSKLYDKEFSHGYRK